MSAINNKHAVSAVIATVLLIMITIAAVAILAGVIIPFVTNQLNKGKACFDATDQLTIEINKFTCYNPANTSVMIRRGTNAEFDINGILFALTDSTGSSAVYKIYDNGNVPGVLMYNGSAKLKIPGAGGAETYILPISSNYVSVAAILPNDEMCQGISENIEAC